MGGDQNSEFAEEGRDALQAIQDELTHEPEEDDSPVDNEETEGIDLENSKLPDEEPIPKLLSVSHHKCTLKFKQRFVLERGETFEVYEKRKRGRFSIKFLGKGQSKLAVGQRFRLGNEAFHVYDAKKRGRYNIRFIGFIA